jgi:hypothetical protein
MKQLFAFCLALVLAIAPVSAQMPISGAGGAKKPSAASSPPTWDGSCVSTFNGHTCSITTTQTNNLVVAVVGTGDGGEVVTGGALTWTKVGTGNPSLWWAISSGILTSSAISSGTSGQNLTVFAVHGAHNAAPFDGSILMTNGSTSSITTSVANDLVFSIKSDYCDPVDSTYTQFGLETYQTGEYKTAATATTYNWAWSGCGSTANIVTGAILAGP